MWIEGCGGGGGFGEGGGVVFVGDDAVEGGEGEGFAAADGCGCGFKAKFGHGWDGEVVVGASEGGVRFVGGDTLVLVEVGV